MNELPSRPERFLNHIIEYRASKFSELAAGEKWNSPYVEDAVEYDQMAHDPEPYMSLDNLSDGESITLYTRPPDIDIPRSDRRSFTDMTPRNFLDTGLDSGSDDPIGRIPGGL